MPGDTSLPAFAMSVPGQGPVPELAMQQAGATVPLQELALLQPQFTAPGPEAAAGALGPGPGPSLPVLPQTQPAASGAATAPVTQQPQPQPSPATAQPNDIVGQAKANLQNTQAIGQERQQNAIEAGQLNQQQADAKAKFDEAHAAALAKLQADHAKHRAAADAEIAQKRAEYESTPWTSHWESRSAGQKAMIALGLLFSGISWNSNHVNRGVEMLNQATQEHMALQKERHKDLWQDLQLSMEGKKDLNAQQLQELSQWQAGEAARWQAISSNINRLIQANKGKQDVTAAKQVSQEALDKSTAAWENAIKAAATAKHMTAEDAYLAEQTKTQASIRAKNYAEAANQRAMADNGGMDKFTQQMLPRVQRMLQQDPDMKALYGTTSTPGPLARLPKIAAAQTAIREGIERGDSNAVAVAVTGAREQLTRFLTGVSPTKLSVHMVEALKGTDEEVKSKISRLMGNPQEGEKFAHTIYGFLDEAREQALHETDTARARLNKKHKGKNPIYKNPYLKAEIDNIIDGTFADVRSGDGKPRYGEGQTGSLAAAPAPAHTPSQPQQQRPDMTVNGHVFKWNGTAYQQVQ